MSEVKDQLIRLGPWHQKVEVVPGLTTEITLEQTYPDEHGPVFFGDYRDTFRALVGSVYPDGFQGRSYLDCACNCGGYLFWARELGAARCFGFDVREHWITQARFLAGQRGEKNVDVEVCDLYDVPKLGLQPFDVVQFKGLFYHLPDPITGLKIAADLTNELLILNTSTKPGDDGFLAIAEEGTEQLMSGVHGLAWFPTGPRVLERILSWLGFVETKVTSYIEQDPNVPEFGRIEILASRRPGVL